MGLPKNEYIFVLKKGLIASQPELKTLVYDSSKSLKDPTTLQLIRNDYGHIYNVELEENGRILITE